MADQPTFESMTKAVVDGDASLSEELARKALAAGIDPAVALEQGFTPGVQEVGRLWEEGEYFLPELLMGAEAMKAAASVLQEEILAQGGSAPTLGKAVVGTVAGDLHDIGKTLVATMLAASGFEVIDLGADVPHEKLVDTAADGGSLLCMSALLTTTMTGQKEVLALLKERGLRGQVKVMVGGAPVNKLWADSIGADGYGSNAMAAVREARKLVGAAEG